MSENTARLKEIEQRKEELRTEMANGVEKEERLSEIKIEAEKLNNEEMELRAKIEIDSHLIPNAIPNEEERKTMTDMEIRANALKDNGTMELRALLSTGKIASPTEVGGINAIADEVGSIVDDVKAVALTGNGAYVVAYEKSEAAAADVVDGKALAGTEAAFDYVTINPAEWAIYGEISNQVAKVSPLAYANELERAALVALRAKAEAKIVASVLASSLLGAKTEALGENYLRNLVLGQKAIAGKGEMHLYINREDLITLASARGTDKKPVYGIAFDNGSTMKGTLTEGGLAVKFSIIDSLAKGTQLFGQPQTIEMPMWDNYEIKTDESVGFKNNLIAYRGIQTANADLCAVNGMVKVAQA